MRLLERVLGDREGGIKVTKARGIESGAWRMRNSVGNMDIL